MTRGKVHEEFLLKVKGEKKKLFNIRQMKRGKLPEVFMRKVVLSFGMVAVFVGDADNKFRGVFEEVCNTLKITFWPLARGNHKGNSVDRYYRFLNKHKPYVVQTGVHMIPLLGILKLHNTHGTHIGKSG